MRGPRPAQRRHQRGDRELIVEARRDVDPGQALAGDAVAGDPEVGAAGVPGTVAA
ncbi:MAG: hypothetical protein H6709_08855 [Kofleriaceae bacterium]|nr:hypothetical protein [Kofleriaceae bacterium]